MAHLQRDGPKHSDGQSSTRHGDSSRVGGVRVEDLWQYMGDVEARASPCSAALIGEALLVRETWRNLKGRPAASDALASARRPLRDD